MGCASSSLKLKLQALEEAEKAHAEEINKLQDERRMHLYKISVLEDMVATAHIEAHEKSVAAAKSEERMKAMKWEMVRQSLPNSPRQPVSWELKDGAVRSPGGTNQEIVDKTPPSMIPRPEPPLTESMRELTKASSKSDLAKASSKSELVKAGSNSSLAKGYKANLVKSDSKSSLGKADAKHDGVAAFSSRSSSRASSFDKKTPTAVVDRPTAKFSRGSSSSDVSDPPSGIPKPTTSCSPSPKNVNAETSLLRKPSSSNSIKSIKSDNSSMDKGSTRNTKKPLHSSAKEPESEDDEFVKEVGNCDDVLSN
ncbi:hypothetical protein ACHHYP_11744 [Achlya hypogyna]|uniref:Uncharacterized protein n=1 Tax=Achlya hypogyna TaxID=1202772 RepID=A0A1V9YIF4_ACHHY|nr:hypothetical protein ACHHYP_11744 [Achlya hypogyna]